MSHPPSKKILAPTRPLQLTDAVAAIIVHEDSGRYLLQLRDNIPTIPYPDHWGLFGGSVESGESDEQALLREIDEEISLVPRSLEYFSRLEVDLVPIGLRPTYRCFYEVPLNDAEFAKLVQTEGADMGLFTPDHFLTELRLTPYDSYVLWLHANKGLFETP